MVDVDMSKSVGGSCVEGIYEALRKPLGGNADVSTVELMND